MASESMQLDLEQLRNCFADARTERDQLEQSMERSLANIQALQRRLCQWHIDLCDSREELENERALLAREMQQGPRQLEAQAAEISRLERELAEAREAMAQQVADGEGDAGRHQELLDEMRRLREECDKLRQEQNDAHQALEAEKQTSQELRTALEAAHEGINAELEARLEAINNELAQTRGSLDQRNEVVHGLEQERAALETELEMVRARAAELTESLDQERRKMAEDRAEWSTELKQLRRLLERQARLSTTQPAAADISSSHHTPPDSQAAPDGSKSPRMDDPVVGSVLAQFDRIRQQRGTARAAV